MAQTKTKPKPRSRKESASKRAKSSTKSKASKAKSKSTRAKSRSPKPRSSSNGSASKSSNVNAVRNAVGDAGNTVGKAVSKAKVPLVAGGAALVGTAGGLALAASKQSRKSRLGRAMTRRPKVKIDSKDVARAAKEVGNFSAQVGELANELQRARESANGRRRSPVEVVLQGLTARR